MSISEPEACSAGADTVSREDDATGRMLRPSAILEDRLHSPAPSVSRLALPGFAGALLLGPCPGRRKEALDDAASQAALAEDVVVEGLAAFGDRFLRLYAVTGRHCLYAIRLPSSAAQIRGEELMHGTGRLDPQ